MRNDELERLLWERLDGTICEAGRARLAVLLDAGPAAREQERQLAALASGLSEIREVEPPDGLGAAVAAAVASRQTPRRRRRLRAWLHELVEPRWRVRLAWTCAGLALGVAAALLHPVLRPTAPEEVARYYGSMSRPGAVARRMLELPSGRGHLAFDRGTGTLHLRLVAQPADEDLWLEIEAPGLTLVRAEAGGEAARSVVQTPRGLIVASPARGWIEVEAGVPVSARQARVRLAVGSRVVVERTVELGTPAPADATPTSGDTGGT